MKTVVDTGSIQKIELRAAWTDVKNRWLAILKTIRQAQEEHSRQQIMVQEMKVLLEYPDYLLKDIGLNRGDLLVAIRQPAAYRFNADKELVRVQSAA